MQSVYGSAFIANNENNILDSLKQKEKLVEQLTKKLKNQEKKITEETKMSIELKKRHDVMQKKLQISMKEKMDT